MKRGRCRGEAALHIVNVGGEQPGIGLGRLRDAKRAVWLLLQEGRDLQQDRHDFEQLTKSRSDRFECVWTCLLCVKPLGPSAAAGAVSLLNALGENPCNDGAAREGVYRELADLAHGRLEAAAGGRQGVLQRVQVYRLPPAKKTPQRR